MSAAVQPHLGSQNGPDLRERRQFVRVDVEHEHAQIDRHGESCHHSLGAGVGSLDERDSEAAAAHFPHEHDLIANGDTEDWVCDLCGTEFIDDEATALPRFTCSQGCDYDLCGKCHRPADPSFAPRRSRAEDLAETEPMAREVPKVQSGPLGRPAPAVVGAEEVFETGTKATVGECERSLAQPSAKHESIATEAETRAILSASLDALAPRAVGAPARDEALADDPPVCSIAVEEALADDPPVRAVAAEVSCPSEQACRASSLVPNVASDATLPIREDAEHPARPSLPGSAPSEEDLNSSEGQPTSFLSAEDRRRFGLDVPRHRKQVEADDRGGREEAVPPWTSLSKEDRHRFGLLSKFGYRNGEIPMCRTLIELSEAGLGLHLKKLQDTELVLQFLNGKP